MSSFNLSIDFDAEACAALFRERGRLINDYLSDYPAVKNFIPQELKTAMLYSLMAGGKRLRPVLCLSWASVAGAGPEEILPFAASIEMIHTYSLIHDDLPAMDDDDLRRGKPSCHKAFGEACAILAGDSLLTDAFALALSTPRPSKDAIRAAKELALGAGSGGMAGGQALDMAYTGSPGHSLEELKTAQALKTGALIRASCVCGAILGGGGEKLLESAGKYGAAIGRAFQIADDILDVKGDASEMGKPAGSDQKARKLAWPAAAGMEASEREAEKARDEAFLALEGLKGNERDFLAYLANFSISRIA